MNKLKIVKLLKCLFYLRTLIQLMDKQIKLVKILLIPKKN